MNRHHAPLCRLLALLFILVLLFGLLIAGLSGWAHLAYGKRIYTTVAGLPAESTRRIAIVFGASSITTHAVQCSREPEVMRQTALQPGVPDDALVLDYAGRRTYDTCYRARDLFGVNHAILVGQLGNW